MAEAFLKEICGDHFEAHSAGLEPGRLNPLAVEAMRESDESSAGRCPIFAGVTKRLHWSFPDPTAHSGTHEERLAGTRKIRDQIRARLEMWCDEVCASEAVG